MVRTLLHIEIFYQSALTIIGNEYYKYSRDNADEITKVVDILREQIWTAVDKSSSSSSKK